MRVLHVLPTTDSADELLSRLSGTSSGLGSVLGRQATTFGSLEEELASTAFKGLRRLDDATRSLALVSLLGSQEWAPYERVATRRGFRRAVERFFSELAQGGARFEELARAGRRAPGTLASRTQTLAAIGMAYLGWLKERKLVDPQFALSLACERLEKGAPLPESLEADEIHIHDLIDWTPGRLRVLGALARAAAARGARVLVSLPRSEVPELSEVLEPALKAIESLDAPVEMQLVPVRIRARVRAFDAADDEGERRELARRIQALLRSGVSPGHIAVTSRGLAENSQSLQLALSRQGIPVRDRRGRSLAEARVVRLSLALSRLDSPAACTREKVASIIGSALIDLRGLEESAPRPETMARHLREAAIRSRLSDGDGRDGFDSRLERLADSAQEGRLVERTRSALKAFFSRLDSWPARATRARHARELLSLLEALRVPHRLRRLEFGAPGGAMSRESLEQTQALAFEQSAWRAASRTVLSLAEAAAALGLEAEEISRADFASALEERLEAQSLRSGETRGAAVELLEPNDLAGRALSHVFFIGADSDSLPGPGDDETLFSDDERRLLNKTLGRAVLRTTPPAGESSLLPSRQLLRAADAVLAFTSALDELTLSHARADARGRPKTPSPLWEIASAPPPESLPFVPLEPSAAARHSDSILERREASLARTRFFSGGEATSFSGDLSDSLERLQPFVPGGRDHPLSAGALEQFTACAFRWFSERILRLEPGAEALQTASALEAGKLAHSAMESAVKAIKEADLWSPEHEEAAVSLGVQAAARTLDIEEPRTVVGHPQLRAVERERLLRRIARILAMEIRATTEAGLRPHAFELAFGLKDAEYPPFELEGVHMSGRIDRLDIGPAGAQIIDYKSGAPESNARKLSPDRLLSLEFQLPLYVAAVRELVPGLKELEVDALYVSLKNGERSKTLNSALKLSFEEALQSLSSTARDAVDRIGSGQLAPSPQSCEHCDLRPVCRIPRQERSR